MLAARTWFGCISRTCGNELNWIRMTLSLFKQSQAMDIQFDQKMISL